MTKARPSKTTPDSDSFLFGATLLGHCVEGENYASDWWRWEQRPGRIAGDATSQTAADHWSRFQADFKLTSKLGLNCLLVSLEWSRIEPKPGEFERDALGHYERVLKSLITHGITPIVALQAITLPAWFAERGGWAHEDAEDAFAAYVEETARVLSPHCCHWIPLYRVLDALKMGHLAGVWPPGRKNALSIPRLLGDTGKATIRASEVIRGIDPDAQIGLSINTPDVLPYDEESPWDYRAARALNEFDSGGIYEDPHAMFSLGDAIDDDESPDPFHFWVVSMPGRRWIRFAPTAIRSGFIQSVDEEGVDAGFLRRQPDPARVSAVVQQMQLEDLPILFVGGAHDFADDRGRCEYLLDHVEAIQDLRDSGERVLGYVHESLLDGFEWDRGDSTRRGLVHVDWDSFARTPNQSAYLLGDIARHGQITTGAVRKYCPGWQSKLEAVR